MSARGAPMTRRSFYDAFSRAVRELKPEVDMEPHSDLRFSLGKAGFGRTYCPITLVHRHRTGEAVEVGEAWEVGKAMGLAEADIDVLIDAADWDDEEPRVRAALLRRAGVAT